MSQKLVDESGIRLDGRKADELRNIKIEAGVLHNADGSAYIEWGKNKVLAAVYGPREIFPKFIQNPTKAVVQVQYNMAAFSVDERIRPGPARRSTEISKIISEALERVIFTNKYPRTSIDVFIEILEASAGTRCAGLTAASVAVADAGIPMMGLVPACASGKADGHVLLDLGKEEDNIGEADLPVGYLPKTDEIVLLQMDGHLTREEFDKAFELAKDACIEIHEMQKEALRTRYSGGADAINDDSGSRVEQDLGGDGQRIERASGSIKLLDAKRPEDSDAEGRGANPLDGVGQKRCNGGKPPEETSDGGEPPEDATSDGEPEVSE